MINSRNIDDLHPTVKKMAEFFLLKCSQAGIDVTITSTFRDYEYQDMLYAKGRTTKGPIVTKAKAGQSIHNWKCAFDFCPIVKGKAVWDNDKLWKQCGQIAKECGLTWGGDFVSFVDKPHCQFTGGLSLRDFQQGKQLP